MDLPAISGASCLAIVRSGMACWPFLIFFSAPSFTFIFANCSVSIEDSWENGRGSQKSCADRDRGMFLCNMNQKCKLTDP